MSEHNSARPEQRQTETIAVFEDTGSIELVDRVEVPYYSQPDGSGTRLSREKREALAVNWAVPDGIEGETYLIMESDGSFTEVELEDNPAFAGVWEPPSGVEQ